MYRSFHSGMKENEETCRGFRVTEVRLYSKQDKTEKDRERGVKRKEEKEKKERVAYLMAYTVARRTLNYRCNRRFITIANKWHAAMVVRVYALMCS